MAGEPGTRDLEQSARALGGERMIRITAIHSFHFRKHSRSSESLSAEGEERCSANFQVNKTERNKV